MVAGDERSQRGRGVLNPCGQAQQDDQGIAVDLARVLTRAQHKTFASSAEVPVLPSWAAAGLQNPLDTATAGDDPPLAIQPSYNIGVGVGFFASVSHRDTCDSGFQRFRTSPQGFGDNLRFCCVEPKSPGPLASGRDFWKAVPD